MSPRASRRQLGASVGLCAAGALSIAIVLVIARAPGRARPRSSREAPELRSDAARSSFEERRAPTARADIGPRPPVSVRSGAEGAEQASAAEPSRAVRAGDGVSGSVIDASGGPIAGARLEARSVGGEERAEAALSDDVGQFELSLPAGTWELSVHADGYASTRRLVESPTSALDLPLSPAARIRGRVVSGPDRDGVGGVSVSAVKSNGRPYSRAVTLSDATGSFELRDLPPGIHELTALSADYRGEGVRVELYPASALTDVELEVRRATSVVGVVRVRGAACADAVVELSGPVSVSAVAAADGAVELQGVVPGEYGVDVSCRSALPHRERVVVGSERIVRAWELDAGIAVRGSVQTAAGRTIANAVVTLTRRDGSGVAPAGSEELGRALQSSCASDAGGEFECAGLEPAHYVSALYVGGRQQRAAHALDLTGTSEPEPLVLRADESATLRARVIGEPRAPGAAVAVFACDARGQATLARRDGDRFVLEGLALGRYTVHAGTSACAGEAETVVSLERDAETVEVDVSLPPAARVRGRLLDAQGVPVPDAWVRAADSHRAWALLVEGTPAVMTNAEGEFELSGLLPGRYELLAHGTGDLGVARVDVELAAADERELRLVLSAPASPKDVSPVGRPATKPNQ